MTSIQIHGIDPRVFNKETSMDHQDDPFREPAKGKTLLWVSEGRRYQVWRDGTDEDVVSFCTQGGGWLGKMPRDEFLQKFERLELDPSIKQPAFVESDWIDGRLPCHSNGNVWNGWGMPEFELATAMALAEKMPELRYDEPSDSFIWSPSDDPEEWERYGGREIISEDRLVKTYPIGAGSWTWQACETATANERLETAAMEGDERRVILAIADGADPNAKNRAGEAIRDAARSAGQTTCADLLDGLAGKATAREDSRAGQMAR